MILRSGGIHPRHRIVRTEGGDPLAAFSSRTLSASLAAMVLFFCGCLLTPDQARNSADPFVPSNLNLSSRSRGRALDRGLIVRLQSPESQVPFSRFGAAGDDELPPLPDFRQTALQSDESSTPGSSSVSGPEGPESIMSPEPAVPQNSNRDEGRSGDVRSGSLTRSANRPIAAPEMNSRGRSATDAGRVANSGMGNMSPRLRNRVLESSGGNEESEFNYPEIDEDPAEIYRDRFGVEGEYDPFLFPWLVNLIFEDRWLLAEQDPSEALRNQLKRRLKIDIRDPDPDTANFPNGAYTLPKGRLYIENSPLGLYRGSGSGSQPGIYQWEYLIRYGLTDNLEFRVFSNGLSVQSGQAGQPGFTGFQPLAFDFKANFWEENTKYHIPAMGVEIYLQTPVFGSAAFNSGTQPSISLLFDQSLPWGIGFEYNFGYTGAQNSQGQIAYQFSYQWSFQREIVKDFDVFFHGFYNAAALPRLNQFQTASQSTIPNVTVVGFGAIKTVNNRLSIFGSYNFGVTPDSPKEFALLGFAVAL